MKFEWDEDKSESNYKKHSIRFDEAQTVFVDPDSVEFFDDEHSEEEDRFIRVGRSLKMNVLLVVFCERDANIIRIISARKATPQERRDYEKGI